MTIDAKLMNALNALADTTIQIITETTGNQPNDYAVRDVARSIATKPYYDAQRKRKYVDGLFANIAANTVYHEGTDKPLADNHQPKQYHDAKQRYETLGPRIELEAMAFDELFEQSKAWFLEYTGDHLDTSGAKAPANKLTKAQQAALKAIEKRNVAKVA